jgi:hypothetical protein
LTAHARRPRQADARGAGHQRCPGRQDGRDLLFTAACFTSLGAWIGYDTACLNYEGAEACLGRDSEWAWHLVLALVGWAAACFMLHFAFRGPRRAFVALSLVAPVLYAISILFAGADTHGWDNLKVFQSFDLLRSRAGRASNRGARPCDPNRGDRGPMR